MLLPPWPWTLRRVGAEPEDWEAEGFSAYYGLEFLGSTEYPPNEICDFLVPSNWTLEGTFGGGTFDFGGSTYSFPSGTLDLKELPTKLGGSSIGGIVGAGAIPWDELDSVYELVAHGFFTTDVIVTIATNTASVTATCAGEPDIEVYGDSYAYIHLPECCKNEDGEVVWRMKIFATSQLYYFPPAGEMGVASIRSGVGVDFVDADYPAYSKSIDAPSGDFTLTLTIEREAYIA
jgi:hypothetical protein